ncbi:MAG: HAD-IA family hydrolase [Candidatus Hydrogenedentes bacterium]|nr:HAD-IA family hydrolase [Candidatus Hydrogenedentota bacterium]
MGGPRDEDSGGVTRVRAVLFDAAGTLLSVHPSVGHVYADEARKFGVALSPHDLDRHFHLAWTRHRPQTGHGTPFHTSEAHERAWWRELVWDAFTAAGAPYDFMAGFDTFFDGLYERFAAPHDWHVFDDVMPALESLRNAGARLAVVSNWDSRLPRLLKGLGLSSWFDLVITSAEAGVSKPHPDIFHIALDNLGLDTAQAVHVGDSEEEDIAGAHAAGLRAVRIDRDNATTGALHSLLELPAHLGL